MKIHITRVKSLRLVITLVTMGLGACPAVLHADFKSAVDKFLHKDVDVITVTDVTEAGRAYAPATPDRPVRYRIVYLGYISFGNDWAGESIPANKTVFKWMMEAMRKRGYLLADEQHPPEQTFFFAWGMYSGKSNMPTAGGSGNYDGSAGIASVGAPRQTLRFLGGEKANLMWEQAQFGGFVDPRVLLRGMIRTDIAGKVWDIAESDLFLGIVRSYPEGMLNNPKAPLLWETRFGCPATGLRMDQAMPLLVTAAAENLGRETDKPVNINATEIFGGNVTLGELKVLGTDEKLSPTQDESGKPAESSPK